MIDQQYGSYTQRSYFQLGDHIFKTRVTYQSKIRLDDDIINGLNTYNGKKWPSKSKNRMICSSSGMDKKKCCLCCYKSNTYINHKDKPPGYIIFYQGPDQFEELYFYFSCHSHAASNLTDKYILIAGMFH